MIVAVEVLCWLALFGVAVVILRRAREYRRATEALEALERAQYARRMRPDDRDPVEAVRKLPRPFDWEADL